jgi:hypothetical protein
MISVLSLHACRVVVYCNFLYAKFIFSVVCRVVAVTIFYLFSRHCVKQLSRSTLQFCLKNLISRNHVWHNTQLSMHACCVIHSRHYGIFDSIQMHREVTTRRIENFNICTVFLCRDKVVITFILNGLSVLYISCCKCFRHLRCRILCI